MRLTDIVLDSLPCKRQFLQIGARLPPGLRTRVVSRGLRALASRLEENVEFETNMGIDPTLACLLPSSKAGWIFGLPEHYLGERGALELASALGRSCDAVVDVGAHLGYYTYFLAKRIPNSIPIYFFEPDPLLYALVERNVRRRSLKT